MEGVLGEISCETQGVTHILTSIILAAFSRCLPVSVRKTVPHTHSSRDGSEQVRHR